MAGMNAATMRLLAAKGLSLDDIVEIAESLEKKVDPTNAQRQARYRARHKNNTVTVTGVSPPIEEIIPPVSSDEETSGKRSSPAEKPKDVTVQTWTDFTAMRRTQKAPVSKTAVAGIRREAEKAGWTLEAALAECSARGWRGFKAEWVAEQRSTGPPAPVSFLDHLAERRQSTGQPAKELQHGP